MKYASSSVLLLAALALGQNWIVEQIDSNAASQSPVELVKAADGKLWTGYETDSGVMRVACLGDSGWSKTDVCTASVAPTTFRRPFLAAGPHGEICLSCGLSDSGWIYRLVQDTWQREPYPFMNATTCGTVAYDTAGYLYSSFAPSSGEFWVGHETDSGWTSGFVVQMPVGGPYYVDIDYLTVAADGSPWFFGYGSWYDGYYHSGDGIELMHLSGDTWISVWGRSGGGDGHIPVGLAPHGDGVSILTDYDGSIQCDSEPIAPVFDIPVAGLTYSPGDVPLAAWVPLSSSAVPMFASKTNRWHTETVPGPAGIGGLDIEVSDSGEVFIVYSTQDSGLWCARGMTSEVVGIRDGTSRPDTRRALLPTIIRSMPKDAVIFDAMGRRVANPKPGVYFVRDEGQMTKDEATGRMRKVVITR
jgi:hypothetical protein